MVSEIRIEAKAEVAQCHAWAGGTDWSNCRRRGTVEGIGKKGRCSHCVRDWGRGWGWGKVLSELGMGKARWT